MANTHSLDLEFSSSQYASIADASQTGLDITTDHTFEAWINLETLPSTLGSDVVIMAKDDVGTSRAYAFVIRSADDKLNVVFINGGNTTRIEMDEAFVSGDLGTWIHVAAAVDISVPSAAFYKNTVSKSNTAALSAATAIDNSTAPFFIGAKFASSSATQFFDGLIDDARIWSDIRTSGEISANWKKELVGNEANLVGYWKLNNDYTDETSNSNDLTASGSPVFSTSVPVWDAFVPRVSFIM